MKVFDLHCDTIGECCKTGQNLMENRLQVSLEKAAGFSRWAQVFAVWIDDSLRGQAALDYFHRVYRYFLAQLEKYPARIAFCRSGQDLDRAWAQGKAAAFLSVEGGAALAGQLEQAEQFYQLGVRLITLTWNGENELGGGAHSSQGLTLFGRQVVAEMERLGMAVDVSHLNDRTFWDVCRTARKPFLASHSNSRFLCPHPRNLTDSQLAEIGRRGGLVGLNLYEQFLKDPLPAGMEDAYRHLCRLLDVAGEDAVALGCDFDGAQMPPALDSLEKLADFYTFCMKKGMEEPVLQKVFAENAKTVFSGVLQGS